MSRVLWPASLALGLCVLAPAVSFAAAPVRGDGPTVSFAAAPLRGDRPTASAQTFDEAARERLQHEHPRAAGASVRRAPSGRRPIFLGLLAALFLVIGGLAGAADKKSS